MKHFGKLAFGAIALLLASCSSDEPIANNPENNGADDNRDFYATLNLRLPSGTRADNPAGEEFGKDYENNVGKILVVLATKDATSGEYKFLTYSETDAKPTGNGEATNQLKYTLNFSAKEINPNPLDKEEPGAGIPGTQVYVFAYCNPTAYLSNFFQGRQAGQAFTDEIATIVDKDNSVLWAPNKFVMTNCEIPEAKTIPARNILVESHNTPEKAFNLGTVRVKRAAARFDFALGGENNDNKYEIKDIDATTVVGEVELTEMAMFNIAKKFYYLPRTNSNWTWTGATTLCGDLEGFVMSFNEGNFKKLAQLNSSYTNYFFCNLIDNDLQGSSVSTPDNDDLTWTSIRPADWNKEADNDEGWSPSEGTNYRIWRYTTENTIPADANGGTASQKIGITTGVVFKGEFTPVNKQRWNGNVVYTYNNIVYGDYTALKTYVEKNPESLVAAAFNKVSALKNAAADVNLKTNLIKNLSDKNGFKAYEANNDGRYVMYYFYYNRHLTNNNNSLMGENEFGVVRNNVYKLRVNTCGSLGEPESPNKPDDPDEKENAYFTVNCIVMPWTVRINDIDF